ncbi:MAG: glycosyltransferase [Bacteroidia bacterium]
MPLLNWPEILEIAFFVVSVAELIFLFFFFIRLPLFKVDCDTQIREMPVSVIISAKNEARNLSRYLPLILEQDYSSYEVIVVNDKSFDNTRELLEELSAKYPHLQVVQVEEHIHDFKGKKLGLTLAIKRANHEFLLFTDADCRPRDKQWLKLMQRNLQEKDIVLGFSPYMRKGNLINTLIQYETFHTAFQYFSFALAGMPYMGVGRNMGYKRSLFFSGKGFANHLGVASGDDDLFVNQHATKENVAIELCPETHILSEPKENFSQWMYQKRRHLTSGKFYRKKHRAILLMSWWINFLFYALFAAVMVADPQNYIVPAIFGGVFLSRAVIIVLSLKKLKMMFMAWWVMLLDILFQLFLYPLLGLFMMVSRKPSNW